MYKIELSKPARKAYLKLPTKTRKAVYNKLCLLAENPQARHNDVKKLHGCDNGYRLRVQDWRVIYRIEHDVMIIDVVKIAHRREVYR